MKHLGWEMRIDNEGDIRLRESKSGRKCYIFVWHDDFITFPIDIPNRIIEWSLRKRMQEELRLQRREAKKYGRKPTPIACGYPEVSV